MFLLWLLLFPIWYVLVVFANGGWRVTPYVVQSVTDQTGKAVFAADPPLARPDCNDAAPPDPLEPEPPD